MPNLEPRAPLADLPTLPAMHHGVIASGRDGLGLATVLVRKGRSAALTQRLRDRFSIEMPQGSYRTTTGDLALMGTGPDVWLAAHQRGGNAFVTTLREVAGDLASISDHSDGYAVLRLSGPKVRDTLCKLVPVDVHPLAFTIGSVAVTVAAQIGATLWRLADDAQGSPVFEIAVFRSLSASFWHALSAAAAEFGLAFAHEHP
jgi:methylglutamate dehydrogenase subunit D